MLGARLDLATPSMVDDWGFATAEPRSLEEILRPFTTAESRFRPGWELWNELQWHTLGAPGDLTGPNIWAALRMLLFVAGVVLVPAVVAAGARDRPSPFELAALAGAAGALIFCAPIADLDLLRLGPTEPLMFGAVSCGAGLLLAGVHRLLTRPAESTRGTAVIWLMLVAGYGLWLLGAYHKEATLIVVVLAPFAYLHLDRRWREAGGFSDPGPLWRRRPFQVLAILMLIPIAHIAVMTALVSGEGVTLYGAEQPSGPVGWVSRAFDSLGQQWDAMTALVGTPVWRAIALALPLALAAVAFWRRRVPWLALGLVISGWAVLVFQGIPLLEQSRYYLPVFGCWTAAALLLAAESPRWARWIAVGAALLVATLNAGDVRRTIDGWEQIERDDAELVKLAAGLAPGSCPVYLENVDLERSESLPRLVQLSAPAERDACGPYPGVLIRARGPEPFALGSTRSIARACAGEAAPIEQLLLWEVVGCRRFAADVDGEPVEDVLRQNRLLPGQGLAEVRERCAERFGRARCAATRQTAELAG